MKNTAKESFKVLDKIKKYIEEGEMSFLIGAGFSRNVNPDAYPLWGDLLKDAIWDFFGGGNRAKKENVVLKKAVKEYGYLGIASHVVKKAGYHEAIDTYIERKTPYLKTVNKKQVLLLQGKAIPNSVSSDCHLLLKKLNIRNIYTFNYDNALEYFMGEEARIELEKEINKLEDELVGLRNSRAELGDKKDEPQIERSQCNDIMASGEMVINSPQKVDGDSDEVDSRDRALEEGNSNIEDDRSKENELVAILETKKSILNTFYNVVKDSYDISLSAKRKSIYKIHGSLRENPESDYGFDGDRHTQYIITQEDYDTYNEKHGAFVNMMRIDLLRNRFCIMGVSGGDANFLAWINWVKDVLDKAKDHSSKGKQDVHQSYFIYSSSEDMPSDLVLMLKNHFIEPIILKDVFPSGQNDEERIRLFLEYVQPLNNSDAEAFRDLWKTVDVPREYIKPAISIDEQTARDLFRLSGVYKYHHPNSIVHYRSTQVQWESRHFLSESVSESECRKYAAAMQCSMLPIDVTCDLRGFERRLNGEVSRDVKAAYERAYIRSVLLLNLIPKKSIENKKDDYSRILQNLFDYKFPTLKEVNQMEEGRGIGFVRKYSLLFLMGDKELKNHVCQASDFGSLQELVLATDWLKYIGYKNLTLFDKADEYKRQGNLLSLYDYCRLYVEAMHGKDEVSTYGNAADTIHLGRFPSDVVNAAVLVNSFVELGICFAGYSVLDENEWIEVVRALKSRYPEALLFYTIVRNENDKVLKAVAQEMMYDYNAYKVLPIVLKNLMVSLVSDTTPDRYKGKMARLASEILPAVGRSRWSRVFESNAEKILDIADDFHGYFDSRKKLYGFVADALEYINAKELRIRILKRILNHRNFDDRFDGPLNTLAISARKRLTKRDFSPLYKSYMSFAKKAKAVNNQTGLFIVINLLSLLDRKQQLEVLKSLEERAIKDSYMSEGYVMYIKDDSALVSSFKSKFLKGQDFWHSGVMDDGYCVDSSNVKVSRISQFLRLTNNEVVLIYNDLTSSLEKIDRLLQRERQSGEDRGWMSPENTFRECVIDMCLFVHHYRRRLERLVNYRETFDLLTRVYDRCFFGKSFFQLIAEDKIYMAIRKIMVETELFGIDGFQLEYEQIVGRMIAKNTNELNNAFRHVAWTMKHYADFFNREVFKKLFAAVLEVYRPYFDDVVGREKGWDLSGCQKEVAEYCLVQISNTLESWGCSDGFWNKYKRKFYYSE